MLRSLLIIALFGMHPVHVGFISMDYSGRQGGFKTLVRIYADDFILDYNMFSGGNTTIDTFQKSDFEKKLIQDYFNSKIEFYADGRKVEGKVEDYDSAGGEMNVNLFYRTGKNPVRFRIKCNIMTALHTDQANYVIFRCNNFEEAFKLSPETVEKVVEISK